MALRNCDDCDRMFDSFGGSRRCISCLDREESEWRRVRDYVKANPGVNMHLVEEATGVSQVRIREFIKKGLMDATSIREAGIHCLNCNAPVNGGEYCDECRASLADRMNYGLQRAAKPELPRERPKDSGGSGESFVSQFRNNRKY